MWEKQNNKLSILHIRTNAQVCLRIQSPLFKDNWHIPHGHQYWIEFAAEKTAQGYLDPISMGMWEKQNNKLSVLHIRTNAQVCLRIQSPLFKDNWYIPHGHQYWIDFATEKTGQGYLDPICMGMWEKTKQQTFCIAYSDKCPGMPTYPGPLFKDNWYTFRGGNTIVITLPPFEEGSTLKGKILLPMGANSFLLE